jgi:DNA-directed RNA polymerase II subunit RPB1
MVFNKMKMNQRNITMYDVYKCVSQNNTDEIECIYSDDNADNLVFRIQTVGQCEESYSENIYIQMKQRYNEISNMTIKGVTGITACYLEEDTKTYVEAEDGSLSTKSKEWCLSTDGTNLEKIINLVEVDARKTISNDINEIYKLFGIEAARQALIEEITNTLSATAYVNYRHIAILADAMTNRGIMLPIDIHGVKKSDIGPLARASFEETVDQLVKSSCFAEADKMSGVSANIMLGQVPPSGTGNVQLLFDERKMYVQAMKTDTSAIHAEMAGSQLDINTIREQIEKNSVLRDSCLNPVNYEFDFIPMKPMGQTIRLTDRIEFKVI